MSVISFFLFCHAKTSEFEITEKIKLHCFGMQITGRKTKVRVRELNTSDAIGVNKRRSCVNDNNQLDLLV